MRQKGVRVLLREVALQTLGIPILNIEAKVLTVGHGYLYSVRMDLRQVVILDRDRDLAATFGTTWSADLLGFVETDNMPAAMGQATLSLVDLFAGQYRAMNPVTTSSAISAPPNEQTQTAAAD